MITFVRTTTALPGKLTEALMLLKTTQAVVKKVSGVEASSFAVAGGVTGQFVSMLQFKDLGHYEEVVGLLLANAEYHAEMKKWGDVIAPGSSDQLLRSL